MSMATINGNADTNLVEYVTVTLDDQLFGLPIARVQDVFVPDRLTRVPLSPPEIAGVLNLRGRIVTAIDMRCRLGLPRARRQGSGDRSRRSNSRASRTGCWSTRSVR